MPSLEQLEAKEKELQAARQVWAIFDALGPSNAPKKCDRPFVGRQQERYQEYLAFIESNHKREQEAAALREKCDMELSVIEAMFILKGLTKLDETDDKELTTLQYWHMELTAYNATKDAAMEENEDQSLIKLFEFDNICKSIEYVTNEGTESLFFTTRRRGRGYNINITVSQKKLELVVEPQVKETHFTFTTDALRRLVKQAMKKGLNARQMVRNCCWKYIDKMEAIIQELNS